MNALLLLIITVILLVAIIIIWYIATGNSLKRIEIKVQESLSDIDVALIKRHDTLVKMLDVCKSYTKFEKDTMLESIRLRSGMSMIERNQATLEMDSALHNIQAVAENYPVLQSNENFRQLQISIMDTEEHLQASRRFYNSNVSILNQKIVTFPTSIVAKRLDINCIEFLKAEDAERQDVRIDLM